MWLSNHTHHWCIFSPTTIPFRNHTDSNAGNLAVLQNLSQSEGGVKNIYLINKAVNEAESGFSFPPVFLGKHAASQL